MPDYKKMYFQLFNTVTQAVELLQEGQQKTEESFLSQLPPSLREASTEQADE